MNILFLFKLAQAFLMQIKYASTIWYATFVFWFSSHNLIANIFLRYRNFKWKSVVLHLLSINKLPSRLLSSYVFSFFLSKCMSAWLKGFFHRNVCMRKLVAVSGLQKRCILRSCLRNYFSQYSSIIDKSCQKLFAAYFMILPWSTFFNGY